MVERNSLILPQAAKTWAPSTDLAIKQLCVLEFWDIIVNMVRLKDLLTKTVRFLHQHFRHKPDLRQVQAENFLNCSQSPCL